MAHRPFVPAAIAVSLASLLAGCGRQESRPAGSASPSPATSAAAAGPAVMPRFAYLRETGIDLVLTSGYAAKNYIVDGLGSGACLIDYDADGLLDVYVVNGSTLDQHRDGTAPGGALYRNRGDWTFTDVTGEAGVPGQVWGQGCAVGDVDNDGDPDLYLSAIGKDLLYLNNGDRTFTDCSAASGLVDPRWTTSAGFLDYDADGRLDLYTTNYIEFDFDRPPEPSSGSGMAARSTINFADRNIAVFMGPHGLVPAADVLYRGNGDGSFIDVTESSGVLTDTSRYGLGVVSGDVDDDGDQDIYVANDSQPNFLFFNQGGGRLKEGALLAGAGLSADGRSQAGMGVAMGDVDGDGREEIFVTNFAEDYNTLYRNLGGGMFTDGTSAAGLSSVSYHQLGWGTGLIDAENDGDLDLFIANGHVYPQVDLVTSLTTWRMQNQLLLNDGSGSFSEVTDAAGLVELWSSRGAAFGDLDNDGDLDVLVTVLDEPVLVLRNETSSPNHWIGLRLQGTRSNRDGYGARVKLTAQGRDQARTARAAYSFLSSNDPRVHFGLGAADRADRLEVRWPSGTTQTVGPLAADRYWLLVEGEAEARPLDLPRLAPQAGAAIARAATPAPAAAVPEVPLAITLPVPPGLTVAARMERAEALLREAKFDDAIAWCRSVLGDEPGKIEAHLLLARAASRVVRHELAERHLREAVRLGPERPDAREQFAEFVVNLQTSDEADSATREAVRVAPASSYAHYLRGIVLARLGRHAEAVAEFDLVLKAAGRRSRALQQRALSLIEIGRDAEAARDLKEALEEDPHLHGAFYALQRIEARTGISSGLDEEARARFNRMAEQEQDVSHQEVVVRAAPENLQERLKLARRYEYVGREGEAAKELEGVLSKDRNNVEALTAYARVIARNGLEEEGLKILLRVEKLRPKSPLVRLERGRIYARRGDTEAALREMRQAAELDPGSRTVPEELARLLIGEGSAADPQGREALRWARRAHELGSRDVITLARAMLRAGERAALRKLLAEEIPTADGQTRRELRAVEAELDKRPERAALDGGRGR